MSEDCTVAASDCPEDMPSDHDPPPLPPTTTPASIFDSGHFPLAAAPSTATLLDAHDPIENESVDRLAHVLRERASISGGQREEMRAPSPISPNERPPTTKPESLVGGAAGSHSNGRRGAINPISPFSMQLSVDSEEEPQVLCRQRPETEPLTLAGGVVADPGLEAAQSKRAPLRQTNWRPHHNSNSYLENMLNIMVEHNVQCNVKASNPLESPVPAAMRPSFSRIPWSTDFGGKSSAPGFDDLMDLEVDPNYCEGNDETLLDDTFGLREAGAPAGIRKHGGTLRYRTSADAGAQSRNMKKNVPRMRRRPKTKTTAPSAAPTGSNSNTI